MNKDASVSVCKYCGATFEQRQSKGRKSEFCSEECRRAQHYLSRKMNVDPNKKVSHAGYRYCKICGTRLNANQAVYCSDECRFFMKKRKIQKLNWDEIIEGMERTELSYGQYVGRYDNVGTN